MDEDGGPEKEVCVIKVLLLGASGVGKTNLLLRYVKGSVIPTEPTIGVEFASKSIELDDETTVRLQIWDTAGSSRYRNTDSSMVYKYAVGALLVYDVTVDESFESLNRWIDDLNAAPDVDISEMVVMVVGNKADLPDHNVPSEKGRRFAEERGFLFCETSADKNEGVDEAFEAVAKAVMDRLKPKKPCETKAKKPPLKRGSIGSRPAEVREASLTQNGAVPEKVEHPTAKGNGRRPSGSKPPVGGAAKVPAPTPSPPPASSTPPPAKPPATAVPKGPPPNQVEDANSIPEFDPKEAKRKKKKGGKEPSEGCHGCCSLQ